jgi:hypothetical protein
MERALDYCWAHDIITVVAAGNSGARGESLDRASPQKLGTVNNGLITVGGVDKNGVFATTTSFNAGKGGSLTVYAVSEDVVGADWESNAGSMTDSGTSFAAPAVAGLAAYFASLPILDHEWTKDHAATDMKSYIANFAYRRSANPIPQMPPRYRPVPPADSIIVAYNRAPDGLCLTHLPPQAGNQAEQELNSVNSIYSSGDFDVVVNGTMVVSSLSQSYCYNTSFSTLAPSTTTTNTAPTLTNTASPSPTKHVDQGILTCGTRTDQGNAKYFFTLSDMAHAINRFCANLTTEKAIFKPGTDTNKAGTYAPLDDIGHLVWVSAKWNEVDDSGCSTLDFNKTIDFAPLQLCQDRLDIPTYDCRRTTTFDLH